MTLNKVDLPQPDGPITARNSPGATVNDTSSRAVMPPSAVAKCMTMLSTTRIAGAGSACGSGVTRLVVETTAIGRFRSVPGARHRRRHDGGVARLDAHIDDGDVP